MKLLFWKKGIECLYRKSTFEKSGAKSNQPLKKVEQTNFFTKIQIHNKLFYYYEFYVTE